MTTTSGKHRSQRARRRPGRLLPQALVGTLALAGLLLPRLAGAEQDALAEAEAAYGLVDFDNTLVHAQAAVEAGGLRPAQLVRAYELIGISATALEQPERAREAYVRMLALAPDAQLDRTLSPSLRGPFMEARGYWAAHAEGLGVEVDLARQRGALRVSLSDPLRMGRTLVMRARVEGEDEFVESRVEASETTFVEVEGASSAGRVEYNLVVLDENGNRIIEVGDDDVPEVVGRPGGGGGGGGGGGEVGPPVTSQAWFWVVIGVVAAAAVAGGVTAGVLLYQQSQVVSVATELSTAF